MSNHRSEDPAPRPPRAGRSGRSALAAVRRPVVAGSLAVVAVAALVAVGITQLPAGDDAASLSSAAGTSADTTGLEDTGSPSPTPTSVAPTTAAPTTPPAKGSGGGSDGRRGSDAQSKPVLEPGMRARIRQALKNQPPETLRTDGPLGQITAAVGTPVEGDIKVAVANIPNTRADAKWSSSVRALINPAPDFVSLNEVYKHSNAGIEAVAPGYTVHRAVGPEQTPGASGQSMNNALLYRTDTWTKLAGGMVKVVNDDRGFLRGKAFLWDRFAVWSILQRKSDGAVVSMVSTHMPTNPRRYPATHGAPQSRSALYGSGMDVLVAMQQQLGQYGPVLVAGDMNSHPGDGPWAAVPKLGAAGYGYVKDQGVMYLFFRSGIDVVSNAQIRIFSDHPALISTLAMNGAGPST